MAYKHTTTFREKKMLSSGKEKIIVAVREEDYNYFDLSGVGGRKPEYKGSELNETVELLKGKKDAYENYFIEADKFDPNKTYAVVRNNVEQFKGTDEKPL